MSNKVVPFWIYVLNFENVLTLFNAIKTTENGVMLVMDKPCFFL